MPLSRPPMTNEIESLTTDISQRRTGNGASPMLLAVVGLAFLLAAYAHWRFSQFAERNDRLRSQLTELRAAHDRLAGQIGLLQAQLQQSNDQVRTQWGELREVPAQVGELGQSVAELRARADAPQRSWVRAEALYLLELATRRLRLENDVPTAIAAMESADARLATVSDPAVAPVRAQLATELAALRAVNVPDITSVTARLAALEAGAGSFRVLGVPVSQARRLDEGAAASPDEGGLRRAAQRLQQAWRDLFSYRRVDPERSRLVTQEEESLRRQLFELELFAARIAAAKRDRASYVLSIRAASDLLERAFDVRDPAVLAAREELAQLAAIDVDPATPEIGTAAQLLQRVIRASAPAPARP
jgi:uroporphyrin-3 C-methyltransferase